ncbi:hypothetical protein H696_05899 [Fonticula alba]|uniref:Uncharacterized protein n=1 Tax=Fonticula alba TaxID=691883 RepID=A0A058Z270_FONAL|nr:hypothetical protein H696_05899 [Fonticula alba]KCV67612.1 hypothetical protein H696_05899 [Fonticula alba]|eukprot:XP_009497950.1 hypothetical protein H696_05899 [Fonticula alba]
MRGLAPSGPGGAFALPDNTRDVVRAWASSDWSPSGGVEILLTPGTTWDSSTDAVQRRAIAEADLTVVVVPPPPPAAFPLEPDAPGPGAGALDAAWLGRRDDVALIRASLFPREPSAWAPPSSVPLVSDPSLSGPEQAAAAAARAAAAAATGSGPDCDGGPLPRPSPVLVFATPPGLSAPQRQAMAQQASQAVLSRAAAGAFSPARCSVSPGDSAQAGSPAGHQHQHQHPVDVSTWPSFVVDPADGRGAPVLRDYLLEMARQEKRHNLRMRSLLDAAHESLQEAGETLRQREVVTRQLYYSPGGIRDRLKSSGLGLFSLSEQLSAASSQVSRYLLGDGADAGSGKELSIPGPGPGPATAASASAPQPRFSWLDLYRRVHLLGGANRRKMTVFEFQVWQKLQASLHFSPDSLAPATTMINSLPLFARLRDAPAADATPPVPGPAERILHEQELFDIVSSTMDHHLSPEALTRSTRRKLIVTHLGSLVLYSAAAGAPLTVWGQTLLDPSVVITPLEAGLVATGSVALSLTSFLWRRWMLSSAAARIHNKCGALSSFSDTTLSKMLSLIDDKVNAWSCSQAEQRRVFQAQAQVRRAAEALDPHRPDE